MFHVKDINQVLNFKNKKNGNKIFVTYNVKIDRYFINRNVKIITFYS